MPRSTMSLALRAKYAAEAKLFSDRFYLERFVKPFSGEVLGCIRLGTSDGDGYDRKVFDRFVDRGLVTRPQPGVYRLTPLGRALLTGRP